MTGITKWPPRANAAVITELGKKVGSGEMSVIHSGRHLRVCFWRNSGGEPSDVRA